MSLFLLLMHLMMYADALKVSLFLDEWTFETCGICMYYLFTDQLLFFLLHINHVSLLYFAEGILAHGKVLPSAREKTLGKALPSAREKTLGKACFAVTTVAEWGLPSATLGKSFAECNWACKEPVSRSG